MLSPGTNSFKATASNVARRLSGFSLLGVSGADSGGFLQAQTMNDLRALAPGRWQWNGWLNPKGRLICLFALWRRAEQDFVAVLPDFPAAELQPMLQRFVFRSRLRLQALDELVAAAGREPPAGPDFGGGRDLAAAVGGGWAFDLGGGGLERRLLLLPADDPSLSPPEPAVDATWRAADLAHGLPRLAADQCEAWTPQMLSLQRLRAFSLNKGCYPGQEIVARTHYLGHAKRELVRLGGAGLAAGTMVTEAGRNLGTVVSARDDGAEALAVLQVERGNGPWLAGEVPASELRLLDGLQRPA